MKRGVKLVTDGTENHLVLLDVSSYGLTGRQAESALLDAGIVTNRNADPARPERRLVHLGCPDRHAGADHPRLRRRRVRPGRRADRRRPLRHHADHDVGRRPVQGEVRARRRRRGQDQGRLVRAARQAPAVPGPRAQLTRAAPASTLLGAGARRCGINTAASTAPATAIPADTHMVVLRLVMKASRTSLEQVGGARLRRNGEPATKPLLDRIRGLRGQSGRVDVAAVDRVQHRAQDRDTDRAADLTERLQQPGSGPGPLRVEHTQRRVHCLRHRTPETEADHHEPDRGVPVPGAELREGPEHEPDGHHHEPGHHHQPGPGLRLHRLGQLRAERHPADERQQLEPGVQRVRSVDALEVLRHREQQPEDREHRHREQHRAAGERLLAGTTAARSTAASSAAARAGTRRSVRRPVRGTAR